MAMIDDDAKLHDWHIEPREYARQEERRGRRHAFTRLIPARTALIVVDMVPFFTQANPYCRGIIPQINTLAEHLRNLGGAVAWVIPSTQQHNPALAREFYGETIADLFRLSGGEGPLPARVAPELLTMESDLFVEKMATSGFFPGASPLDDLLSARGIENILVTGTLTNICCESTARDANMLGYRVVMVADGNAARRDQDHNATLYSIYRSFGDVRPTAEIIALLSES